MKGTVLAVKNQGHVLAVKVKNSSSGKMQVNVADPRLEDDLTALINSPDEDFVVRKSQEHEGKYEIIKIGEYEEPTKKSFGGKPGSFSKGGSKSFGGSKFVKDPAESRRIVMQNSMGHATALAIHNSGGKKVDVTDVIATATTITDAIMGGAKPVVKTKAVPVTRDEFEDFDETSIDDMVF